MPRPLKSEFVNEAGMLLNQMHSKISNFKTLEDPFTHMVSIKCCKEEPEIPKAVYAMIQQNTFHSSIAPFVWQSLEYLKHPHIQPMSSGVGALKYYAGVFYCQNCKNFCPFADTRNRKWLHECRDNEWALYENGKDPIIKWHLGAQCWVLTYTYHNRVEQWLQSKPRDCSWDEKHEVWLIADKIIGAAVGVCKQFLEHFQWLEKTKRAAPAGRVQISASAIHAETVLSFLPEDELKALTRKVFMKLHPDRGGDKEQFMKFNLALEALKKEGKIK